MANAIADRWRASSSFRIALWKNKKIRIGDSNSEHFKPPLDVEEEESALFTELESTATLPPPSKCCSPANGVAILFPLRSLLTFGHPYFLGSFYLAALYPLLFTQFYLAMNISERDNHIQNGRSEISLSLSLSKCVFFFLVAAYLFGE